MQCLDIAKGETAVNSTIQFLLESGEFYSLLLVVFSTSNSGSEDQRNGMLKKFEHFQQLAELYHVYHSIQRFMVRPAAAVDPHFSHSEKSEKVASMRLSRDFKAFSCALSVSFSLQSDFLINVCL